MAWLQSQRALFCEVVRIWESKIAGTSIILLLEISPGPHHVGKKNVSEGWCFKKGSPNRLPRINFSGGELLVFVGVYFYLKIFPKIEIWCFHLGDLTCHGGW